MSNIQYTDEYFNEPNKREFMLEFGSSTQKTIDRIFKISSKSEHDIGKDLHDFNREELRRLFFIFAPKTTGSSNLNVTWIAKYISYCIEQGIKKGISPLIGIDREWAAQFVTKSNKRFWTLNELERDLRKLKLENAQDEILPRLLFESVRGNNNSEILNLKKEDVNSFTNELRLYDSVDKIERTIKVSDKLIQICNAAGIENFYVKSNGNPSKDLRSAPTAELVSTPHLIKSSLTRTLHYIEADTHIVHRRLTNMAEELGESGWTPLNLYYSGLLHKLFIKFQENQNITDEVYEEIFNYAGENSEQVKYRIKSEFLNIETLKVIYANELP